VFFFAMLQYYIRYGYMSNPTEWQVIIFGGAGNDRIDGAAGNDEINGGAGNDRIDGGTGNNVIDGGNGNDRITAGTGETDITGGAGDDVIMARNGQADLIDCGDGNDTVVVDAAEDGVFDCETVVFP